MTTWTLLWNVYIFPGVYFIIVELLSFLHLQSVCRLIKMLLINNLFFPGTVCQFGKWPSRRWSYFEIRKLQSFIPLTESSVIRQKKTYKCVSGGNKCSFFGKFGLFCFLFTSVLNSPFCILQILSLALTKLYKKVSLKVIRIRE